MRVTFDSNILVYAATLGTSDRHDKAVALLDRARSADALLTLQSLGETFHVLVRKAGVSPAAARGFVDRLAVSFRIEAADFACLALALDAHVSHGLQFWDAMLWATAERAGCDILVTEDLQHGRTLGRVTFLNPFGPALPPELDAALAPPEV